MTNIKEFEVSDRALKEMSAMGKSILHKARIFEETFGKIVSRLRAGKQVEDYLAAEFMQAYYLIQTHNAVHDRQAGKALSEEVRRWQAARVRLPYREGLFPFIDFTMSYMDCQQLLTRDYFRL